MATIDREALQERIRRAGLDALIVTGVENVSYLLNYWNDDVVSTARNLREKLNVFIIPRAGPWIFVQDFLNFPEPDVTARLSFRVDRTPREVVDVLDNVVSVLKREGLAHSVLGMDMDYTSARWLAVLQQSLPDAVWRDGGIILAETRLAKTDEEIRFIRQAVESLEAGFWKAGEVFKTGTPMGDIDNVFRHAVIDAGGVPLLSSLSMVPRFWGEPVSPADFPETVEENRLTPLDACAGYERYWADLNRTFCAGARSRELEEAYREGHEFKRSMVSLIRSGMRFGELYDTLKEARQSRRYSGNMGFHAIGLIAHDRPFFFLPTKTEIDADDRDIMLPENMVFCLEVHSWRHPSAEGGIGEEDMYVLKDGTAQRLSRLPEEIFHTA